MGEKMKVGSLQFVYEVICKCETKCYSKRNFSQSLNGLHINKQYPRTYSPLSSHEPQKLLVSYLKFDWQLY